MAGPFRFAPPKGGARSVTRPRLLRLLRARWTHRAVVVVGGAGFGKTTLLAQAVAENELAPAGRDAWIGIEPADVDAGDLAADLMTALDSGVSRKRASAATIADAVWQLAPTEVCLVFDDVHLLTPGTSGHTLVGELLSSLPANGHLLLASRNDLQLPVARLAAAGSLVTVEEGALAFDADELESLAAARGIGADALADAGGWPAMLELLATAGRSVAREFLWQEVIQPLGSARRRVLAALIDLGGGDDALLSAALGSDVRVGEALEGVPLVAVADDGWHRPHSLWAPIARLRFHPSERVEVRRRATRHLIDRARFDDAFDVLAATPLWEELPALFRASCAQLTRHPPGPQLRRWLGQAPADLRQSPPVVLAAGVLASLDEPERAIPRLKDAIAGFRDAGDVDGELGAIAHMGRVAWWTGDLSVLAELAPRIAELADAGHPIAIALGAVGRAIVADLTGDDRAMLEALAEVEPGGLGPAWRPALEWLRSAAHYASGDIDTAHAIVTAALETPVDPMFRETLRSLDLTIRWQLGLELDGHVGLAASPDSPRPAPGGARHNVVVATAHLARCRAHAGDLDGARALLDRAAAGATGDRPVAAVRLASARAALLTAEGDEAAAAAVLGEVLDRHPLDGPARRAWRDTLCLSYVLVPEARAQWDRADLGGAWAEARDHAAAVVAVRQGAALGGHLSRLRLDRHDAVRVHLHQRFAAELAVALYESGRPEAEPLLDALGTPARRWVRHLTTVADGRSARSAKQLLAAVPAQPPHIVSISLLGSLTARRDGVAVEEPALRRERVRALLAYLVTRSAATRDEVTDALWPELDERAGANNLRVTLNHLHRALEPWRTESDPPYFVRSDSSQLRLHRSPQLQIDLDDFTARLAGADLAERDGAPSIALSEYRAAVELWRGEPFSGIADRGWLDLEREQARVQYSRALRRASQLELAGGEPDAAQDLAGRLLQVDPWDEDAHGVVIAAALARGDRSAARRLVERAQKALADIGVEPGSDLRRLAGYAYGSAQPDGG